MVLTKDESQLERDPALFRFFDAIEETDIDFLHDFLGRQGDRKCPFNRRGENYTKLDYWLLDRTGPRMGGIHYACYLGDLSVVQVFLDVILRLGVRKAWNSRYVRIDALCFHIAFKTENLEVQERLMSIANLWPRRQRNSVFRSVFHSACEVETEINILQKLSAMGVKSTPADLKVACSLYNYDVIEFLASKGVIPRTDLLVEACKEGYEYLVKCLLSSNMDRSVLSQQPCNAQGETPWSAAAAFGRAFVIRQLYATFGDHDIDRLANIHGHTMSQLEDDDFDDDEFDVYGRKQTMSPLEVALQGGRDGELENFRDVADALVACGADINATDEKGRTMLHRATHIVRNEKAFYKSIWVERVTLMVEAYGADLEIRDANGNTPFSYAYFSHSRVGLPPPIDLTPTRFLKESNRRVFDSSDEEEGHFGMVPLIPSYSNRHGATLKCIPFPIFFLLLGARLDQDLLRTMMQVECDACLKVIGDIPLYLHDADNDEVLKVLATSTARDWRGRTPLLLAAESCFCPEAIEKLVFYGCDVTDVDDGGHSILHKLFGSLDAIGSDDEPGQIRALCSRLIELGADIEHRDNDYLTPFLFASKTDESIWAYLEEEDTDDEDDTNEEDDTDDDDTEGEYPWWITNIFQVLFSLGADINARDKNGQSALGISVGKVYSKSIAVSNLRPWEREERRRRIKNLKLWQLQAQFLLSQPTVTPDDLFLSRRKKTRMTPSDKPSFSNSSSEMWNYLGMRTETITRRPNGGSRTPYRLVNCIRTAHHHDMGTLLWLYGRAAAR